MPGTIKQNQIAAMAKQMPMALGQQINQAQASQTTALQQSIAQAAQVPVGGTQAAGQVAGAQQAQQAGQVQSAAQDQLNAKTQKAGQDVLAQGAQDAQQRLQRKALQAQEENKQAQATLSNLSSDLKQRLFDSNLSFQKDELGRTLFNDRQLLDYKLSQGLSDEGLANYEQQVREVSTKKMQMLQAAQAKIKQELGNAFQAGQQELDQDQQRFLLEKEQAIAKKIKKEAAAQANKGSMFSAAGTVVGAVVGSYVGPAGTAAGAAAGASIGGAVGNVAASQTK